MVDFTDGTTSGVETKDIVPAMGIKILQVRVPATFVWGTDSLIVDLGNYGASKIAGFLAFIEDTAGSVILTGGASGAQLGTTSVASGVLTFNSTGCQAKTKSGTLVIFAY